MDDRGHWHDVTIDATPSQIDQIFKGKRPVISIGIGEQVVVLKADGQRIAATFDGAEKNRVTLKPWDGPHPYLELAEHVQMQRKNGESVAAQIWDNRGGKIVFRTLPI